MAEWIPHWPAIIVMARHGAFCVAHCYFMSYWSHTPTKFILWVRAGFCVPLNCTCPFKHELKQCNPETILCNCMKPKIHSIMLSGSTSKKVGGDFGRAIDAVDSELIWHVLQHQIDRGSGRSPGSLGGFLPSRCTTAARKFDTSAATWRLGEVDVGIQWVEWLGITRCWGYIYTYFT